MKNVWYILRGDNVDGPYESSDVLMAIDNKLLKSTDWIRRSGDAEWLTVATAIEQKLLAKSLARNDKVHQGDEAVSLAIAESKKLAKREALRLDTKVVEHSEHIIFRSNNITITDRRAIFSGKTYAMSNVTSVCAKTNYPDTSGATVLMLLGIVLSFLGIMFGIAGMSNSGTSNLSGGFISLLVGIGLFMIAIWIRRNSKCTYKVVISSASGEADAFSSYSQSLIYEIVEAINKAIVMQR